MSINIDERIKQIFQNKKKQNGIKINIEPSKEIEIKNYTAREREDNNIHLNKNNNNIRLDSKSNELFTKLKNMNNKMKNQKVNKNKFQINPKKELYIEKEKCYTSRNYEQLEGHISEFLNNKLNLNENENKNYNLITKKGKNNSLSKNKFERYNTENIKYEAIKNYNQFKPKNKNFLDRMKFYSMKKQSEDEFLKIIVEKTIPRIKESEKVKIFNNLIKDSNRRTEAKNRIEIVNQNNNIMKELFTKNNEIKTKIKFNEKEFIQKYKENIDKLKKKEEDLELLRKKKKEEEEKKENDLIYEMRKRNKKASRKTIEKISKRLYNQALSQRLKTQIKNSKSQILNFSKPFFNKPNHKRNLTPLEINNPNNNTKRLLTEEKIITDYNSSKIKNTYPNTFNNTFNNEKKENHNQKNNHIYQSAEKMIDSFFLFSKQK